MVEPPRMLVTGAAGMTGYHVPAVFADYKLVLTDIDTLDVIDFKAVQKAVRTVSPNIVLHLAAVTDLDTCENDPLRAHVVNTIGTRNVAIACHEAGAVMVSFSSTTVYSGDASDVFTELDVPSPEQVYGMSKHNGEVAVRTLLKRYLIVRPGWVFGGFLKDWKFVGVLRRQILQGAAEVVRGVPGVQGNAIYAEDCLKIVRSLLELDATGTFNVVNVGSCSRLEMAGFIAAHYGVRVEPLELSELGLAAKRPTSQVVRPWMLTAYGLTPTIRTWQSALGDYLTEWDNREKIACIVR